MDIHPAIHGFYGQFHEGKANAAAYALAVGRSLIERNENLILLLCRHTHALVAYNYMNISLFLLHEEKDVGS